MSNFGLSPNQKLRYSAVIKEFSSSLPEMKKRKLKNWIFQCERRGRSRSSAADRETITVSVFVIININFNIITISGC